MINLVARVCAPDAPFQCPDLATRFWWKLRVRFPDCLASVIMHNHVHLLLPGSVDAEWAAHTLRVMTGNSKTLNWEPVPDPQVISDPLHARRLLRYIVLNPCRSKLCRDPLEWLWSTYRGYFGAVARPWVSSRQLAQAYGRSPNEQFLAWFHSYVSSDNTVNPTGTRVLKSVTQSGIQPYQHLDRIWMAALAASEATPRTLSERDAPARRAMVHLAERFGWTQTSMIARKLECNVRTVQRLRRRPVDPALLRAALVCLQDDRTCNLVPSLRVPLRDGADAPTASRAPALEVSLNTTERGSATPALHDSAAKRDFLQ